MTSLLSPAVLSVSCAAAAVHVELCNALPDFTARGTQLIWHLWNYVFLHSAARAAAPEEVLASLKVAGVRGEVTIISKAAGLPLSQP